MSYPFDWEIYLEKSEITVPHFSVHYGIYFYSYMLQKRFFLIFYMIQYLLLILKVLHVPSNPFINALQWILSIKKKSFKIIQKRITNPVKHLRWSVYVQMLCLRCLAEFWTYLCHLNLIQNERGTLESPNFLTLVSKAFWWYIK